MLKTLPVVAMTLLLAGCSPVLWLHPIVPPGGGMFDSALAGVWESEDGNDLYVVRRAAGDAYEVTYRDKDSTRKFDAQLFGRGDARFLDLVVQDREAFHVRGHFLVRVWTGEDTLRWAFVDTAWFQDQLKQRGFASEALDKQMIVYGAAADKMEALLTDASDERAHGDPVLLRKLR